MNSTPDHNPKTSWEILIVVVTASFMCVLDSSIVNVALPGMAQNLCVTSATVAWVVSAYLIAISASILLFGRLGDTKGQAGIFTFGVLVFTIGSLLCSLTDSFLILVMARIIQAIGGAGIMANSLGIITRTFPASERGTAIGINGTFVALGALVGPSLGGFIISVADWKYLFWINIPIGIVLYIACLKLLPKHEPTTTDPIDFPGVGLFVLTIVPLIVALQEIQGLGITNPLILIYFLISALSFVVFIYVEKRAASPLLQLRIFYNKWFSVSILCAFFTFIAITCSNIILPFYFQDVLKMTPSTAGLYLTIYPLILSVVAPISGRLSDKIGSEFLTLLGLFLTSAGLFCMSLLDQNPSIVVMVLFIALMSVGNGLFQSPNNSLVMSSLPKEYFGIGGSVNALVRNLGMVFGVALSTTLLYSGMSQKIGYRVNDYLAGMDDAFIYGMRVVYITAALICLIGAGITALRLYGRKSEKKKA